MALRSGDRITLTYNPTIRLSRFDSVKPFVSIHRVLGDDPASDLADLEATLERELYRAILREVGVLADAAVALGENGTLDDLVAWCRKELGDVRPQETSEDASSEPPRKRRKVVKRARRA